MNLVDYDFYELKNAAEHRTDSFELWKTGTPVFRRGRSFCMAIRFDRSYNEGTDLVRVVFNLGANPNPSDGTSVVLLAKRQAEDRSEPFDNKQWSMALDDVKDDTIILQVYVPVTAPVGNWSCSSFTNLVGEAPTAELESKFKNHVYILFNPRCEDDGVYMENEDEITEYVLNDMGKLWIGTDKQPEGRPWVYGQFHKVVLPVAMILLDKSEVPHFDRWNPIKIARAIAAVTNTQDDNGLIYGHWGDDYSGGRIPSFWNGTVAIMEEYLKNGYNSVRYGQCWVFAAAATTICRALGIPCRPVTTFCSAHDKNQSLTIDIYYDQQDEKLKNKSKDSFWNFHVWNEVWMSRPDLQLGFGGWQAIDGTPQEKSENKFRCGPTSVEAVRKGYVTFAYDTQFVYSEVNADIYNYKQDDQGVFRLVNINKDGIGALIVTKTAGRFAESNDNTDMENITHLYKFQDKTEEELALRNAIRSIPSALELYNKVPTTTNDVTFSLTYIDSIALGESFQIDVALRNESNEIRTVSMSLSADSVRNTGVRIHQIKKSLFTSTLKPKQAENISLLIEPEEYINKLSDQSVIKMYAIANVSETKQTWLDDDYFSISKPKLNVQIMGTPSAGGIFEADFSFQNILPVILTNCSYNIQMSGPKERPVISEFRDVHPDETISFKCTFSPSNSGEKTIVATFTSKQLSDIVGSKTVFVE